ncbi:MAG: EAL domain-containing protein, partial [Gammaproteobacteria bacterium]|nr:EAL domain-containing protein [Gammaproteobacteria bacterium]
GTDVLAMCESIHEKFNALISAYYPDGFAKVIATTYTKKDKVGSLLAKLDTLLTQESSSTKEGLVYCDHDSKNSHGLHQWSDLIDQIVKSNNVKFMFQPIKSCSDDNVLYYELFTQFFINKQSIANNQLYAMAERLNKSILLDKMVLSQLLSLGYFAPDTKLAINLTQQSLHDINFRNWLANFFVGNRGKLPELVFEINEDAVLTSVDSSTDFIKMCKRFDIEICIERFGSSFTSFKYLKGLDIDFLKIDGAYIRDLDQNPENNHFIQAVTQIGHGVGIKVLASHVENEASLKLLKELNCNGAQGNYIQRTMYLIEKEPQSECVYSPIKLVPS